MCFISILELKQIVDESTITGSSSSGAAYYADNNETQQENREPVYNAELFLFFWFVP